MTNFKPDHILLRVKNFDETAKWYRDKLGATLQKKWEDNGLKYAYYDINGFKIEIVGGGNPESFGKYEKNSDKPVDSKDHFKHEGNRHLCFVVDNIYKATKKLKKKDVTFIKDPFLYPQLNYLLAFLLDIEGNVIELAQPIQDTSLLRTPAEKINGMNTYIEGKMKRFNLLFAVNGGAFLIAKLFAEQGTRDILGGLTPQALAIGAIIFTTMRGVDIYLFAHRMKNNFFGGSKLVFEWEGIIILCLICLLLILGWIVAAFGTSQIFPTSNFWLPM